MTTKSTGASAEEYAAKIRPLLPLATQPGRHRLGSPVRVASDRFTELVQEYSSKGGNMAALSRELGLEEQTIYKRNRRGRKHGIKAGHYSAAGMKARDVATVQAAVARARAAEEEGGRAARDAVLAKAYKDGVALRPLAAAFGMTYNQLFFIVSG